MHTKQQMLRLVVSLVLLFTGAAWAQRGNSTIRVDVPFEFEVGNRVLPAGVYTIDRESPNILAIHDARRNVVATVTTISAESITPPAQSKVQFYVDGGRTVLARVWNANSRYGYELIPRKVKATVTKAQAVAAAGSSGR